jgi:anaerobic selenocysteine-containing dehydrogenase
VTEVRPTICRYCHAGCGVLVEIDGGRPVRVRGDRENPAYQGYCCVKGQQLADQWAHPERLLHSQKRMPDGSLRPIPVEQAMDEIAERLAAILARHGPRAVAAYTGTYSIASPITVAMHAAFVKAIGTPMHFTSNTIDQPGKAVALALHGAWGAPPQGFTGAKVALFIGINPLVAMSGGLPQANPSRALTRAIEQGFQLLVIDPRRTESARRATLHLQPRPGEDPAILAALLHVILEEGLHDRAFGDAHVVGIEALRAAVSPFTPQRVAELADVAAADLVRAARTFATAGRGIAIAGTGPNMSGDGTLLEYLVLALNTLCGRWLRAGERVWNPGALLPTLEARAQATPPWKAYGFGTKLRVRGFANTAAGLPTAALADEILLDGDERVRALFSTGGNPVAAWPDQLKTIRAMRELELLVQIDIKLSATARLAHYVIAPKLPIEQPGMTIMQDTLQFYAPGYGYAEPYAQYAPAAVEPPPGAEVISEWELFYGLARRMGLALELPPVALIGPAAGTRTPLDMRRKPTSEELLEVLAQGSRVPLADVKKHPHGALFPDPPVHVAPAEPGHTGRLDVGNAEMLHELAQIEARLGGAPGLDARFPYRLIARRDMKAYNSSRPMPATGSGGHGYNPAFMHPRDLARLGLASGDLVRIRSDHAEILGVVEPDTTLREGLVSMSHSFGDAPDRDPEVRRIGANTGRLSAVDRDYERFTGMPRMSNIPVSVARAERA